jgi:hypothetical protein
MKYLFLSLIFALQLNLIRKELEETGSWYFSLDDT